MEELEREVVEPLFVLRLLARAAREEGGTDHEVREGVEPAPVFSDVGAH